MRRILAGMGVLGLAALATTATATASPQDARTITICHATGSALNPYVPVTISADGSNGPNDHLGHDEDIIPPNDGSVLPGGRNLDKIDWWEAGCKDPGSTTEPIVEVTADPDPVVEVTADPDPVVEVTADPVEVVISPDPVVEVSTPPAPVVEVTESPVPGGGPSAGPVVLVVPESPLTPSAGPVPLAGPAPAGAVVVQASPRAASEAASGAAAGRNQGYGVQTSAAATPSAPWMTGLAAMLLSCLAVALRIILRNARRHPTGV